MTFVPAPEDRGRLISELEAVLIMVRFLSHYIVRSCFKKKKDGLDLTKGWLASWSKGTKGYMELSATGYEQARSYRTKDVLKRLWVSTIQSVRKPVGIWADLCLYIISPSWHGTKAASNELSLLTELYRVERESLKTPGR